MTAARNLKVRRRIAAGKLRLRIRDLRNLGPRSEQLLARIGIRDVEALRRRGALGAYLALYRAGEVANVNVLWALVGALEPWPEGTDWREVAASERRLPLLLAAEQAGWGATERTGRNLSTRPRGAPSGSGGREPRRRRLQEEAWAPGLPFGTDADPQTATPRGKAGRRGRSKARRRTVS